MGVKFGLYPKYGTNIITSASRGPF